MIKNSENSITIVNSFCRLGNQLFHFAFLLYLKSIHKNKRSYFLNFRTSNEYNAELIQAFPQLKDFAVQNDDIININNRNPNYINEIQDSKIQTIKDDNSIFESYRGFWQCWLYPATVDKDLRKYLIFNTAMLNEKSKLCLKNINQSFSVSLHIRRGDYEQDFNTRLRHGRVCTEYYYEKAIEFLSEKFYNQEITLYVFSDDIEWVKNSSLLNGYDALFVTWNRDEDTWQDLCLMSNCKHHIIANSSFSWWGAWLNPLPEKKVIAPDIWYNTMDAPDLLPENWIKIPVEPISSQQTFDELTVIIPVDIVNEIERKCLPYIELYFKIYKNISVVIICSKREESLMYLEKNPGFSVLETGTPYSYTKFVNQAIRFCNTKYVAIWNVYSYISPLQFETAWIQLKEENDVVVYPYKYGVLRATNTQFNNFLHKKDFRAILNNNRINAEKLVGLDSIILLSTKSLLSSFNYDNEMITSIRYAAMEWNIRIQQKKIKIISTPGWLYVYNDTGKLTVDSPEDLKIFIETCRNI